MLLSCCLCSGEKSVLGVLGLVSIFVRAGFVLRLKSGGYLFTVQSSGKTSGEKYGDNSSLIRRVSAY